MSEKIPLVLLPAFMATRTLWGPQIEALADIAEAEVVELTPYDSVTKMAEAVLDRAPEAEHDDRHLPRFWNQQRQLLQRPQDAGCSVMGTIMPYAVGVLLISAGVAEIGILSIA